LGRADPATGATSACDSSSTEVELMNLPDNADEQAIGPDAVARIWQHGEHLDTMLFQRGNLFLVAESLLIVAFTGMTQALSQSGSTIQATLGARAIAAFGIALTTVWLYVGHRHLRYNRLQSSLMRRHVPEYRALREAWHMRGPSSLPLVTYFLPSLAGVLWILLLLITWR
jgi:hypothetical protein